MDRARPDLTLHRQNYGYTVGDTGLLLVREGGQWGFLCGMSFYALTDTPIQRWLDRHQLLSLRFARRRDAMHYLHAILDTDPPGADFAPDHRLSLTWEPDLGVRKTSFNGKDWYLRRAARGWTWHASPDPKEKPVAEVRSLWEARRSQLLLTLADNPSPTAVAL